MKASATCLCLQEDLLQTLQQIRLLSLHSTNRRFPAQNLSWQGKFGSELRLVGRLDANLELLLLPPCKLALSSICPDVLSLLLPRKTEDGTEDAASWVSSCAELQDFLPSILLTRRTKVTQNNIHLTRRNRTSAKARAVGKHGTSIPPGLSCAREDRTGLLRFLFLAHQIVK